MCIIELDYFTFMNIQENIPLAPLTTMGVGGPARYYALVQSEDDLREALQFVKKQNIPYYIFGNGSNLLFPDEGYPGLIIHNRINTMYVEGNRVTLGGGVLINTAIMELMKKGFSGFEKIFGVPGTIGGAIFQNVSAYKQEISTYLISGRVINTESLEIETWMKDDFHFSYRMSALKASHGKYLLIDALFEFPSEDQKVIAAHVAEVNKERQIRPIGKSVGSFFANPSDTISAGKLIEAAGLKGVQIGGAIVSPIHANYLMNTGTATRQDILNLAKHVKQKVFENSGIELEEEVRVV